MKACSKCGGIVEPKYEKYGLICRACRTRIATERNRKTPARARAAGARYREAHRERCRRSSREKHWVEQGIRFSFAEYEEMLAKQGGCCAICRSRKPGGPWKSFHVDHDHGFGHVRGLLCSRCNRAIGSFEDSPTLLRAAAAYLEKRQPRLRLVTTEG